MPPWFNWTPAPTAHNVTVLVVEWVFILVFFLIWLWLWNRRNR